MIRALSKIPAPTDLTKLSGSVLSFGKKELQTSISQSGAQRLKWKYVCK